MKCLPRGVTPLGALPGNDALVNDIVCLADIELRAFNEVRKIALEERQIGVALFC
jgi:hypothetical protein